MYNSYCRDVPQQPTANNNDHNHGRCWQKWSFSVPHEAFHPALMHWINRGQPPKQAYALFTGIGGGYPSRHGDSDSDGDGNGDGNNNNNQTTINKS